MLQALGSIQINVAGRHVLMCNASFCRLPAWMLLNTSFFISSSLLETYSPSRTAGNTMALPAAWVVIVSCLRHSRPQTNEWR